MAPLAFNFTRFFDAALERVRGNTWPPKHLRQRWEEIEFWQALRRSDNVRLRQQANYPWYRRYVISPVPRLVSRAKANLLYGEPADHRAANEADQDRLDKLVEENGLAAEEHRAAMIASSESEVWGRIIVDPSLADVPIIDFVTPRVVIPHFRGRFVVGATFVDEWDEGYSVIYRLLTTYEPGAIRSVLYRGTMTNLGTAVGLDTYPRTAGRQPLVVTGFDYPLIAFIPNSIDSKPDQGFGDYQGLEERFLAINETATIGQENMRLTGKKRALVDGKYLRHGKLPAGDDIFVRDDEDATAGAASKVLQTIEYQLGADETIAWLDHLIDTTLSFGGAAPQLVGRSVDGGAISGTALRLKLVHSLMEASGTGTFLDRGLRRLVRAAAIIDSRPTPQNGFGRSWAQPDAEHQVERGDGLPRDDMEAAQWLVLATGAEAISLEERVKWLHPEWTEKQLADEVGRLKAAKAAATPPPAAGGPQPGDPGGPPIPTQRPPVQPQLPAGATHR